MKKKWSVALVATLVLLLDQLTKQIVTRNMDIGQSIPVIPDFLYWTYHRNSGAAFGILQGQMLLFYAVTIVAVAGIVIWVSRLDMKKEWVLALALALILGGALGNFVDRVVYRSVIDFVHTIWWGRPFAIFNVADMALTIGAGLMMLDVLFLERKRNQLNDESEELSSNG